MDESIFRAYDIRGRVPDQINSEVMYKIGLSLGSEFKNATVSYDIRKTSPALSSGLCAGLLESGSDVYLQGLASFGVALYAAMAEDTDLATLVTASHLPPEHNGLKLYRSNGLALSSDEIQRLKGLVSDAELYRRSWKSYGSEMAVDHKTDYVAFFSSNFSADGQKIGVDCGGGAVSLVAKDVFQGIGAEPKLIFCRPNPGFTDRPSEPKPENLSRLKASVVENNLDFGVAFDGDGDRAVILDDTGRYISPELLAILFARHFLEENGKATVVANIECSRVLEDILVPEGVDVKRIPVGHTYLTQYVKDLNADVGVEASGHMLVPSVFSFDDGMVIPMMVSMLIKGNKLSELVKDISIYPKLSDAVEFESDKEKFDVMERFKEFAINEFDRVSVVDGVKIEFGDSWVLVRASNTSPKIRITVEADSSDVANEKLKEFLSIIRGMV